MLLVYLSVGERLVFPPASRVLIREEVLLSLILLIRQEKTQSGIRIRADYIKHGLRDTCGFTMFDVSQVTLENVTQAYIEMPQKVHLYTEDEYGTVKRIVSCVVVWCCSFPIYWQNDCRILLVSFSNNLVIFWRCNVEISE